MGIGPNPQSPIPIKYSLFYKKIIYNKKINYYFMNLKITIANFMTK